MLGLGLYGSVYLLALFLGLVRGHSPFAVGKVMIVSGVAQLVAAPISAWLETKFDPRLLIAVGYVLFAGGLLANGFESSLTDFEGLFWPQVLRGISVVLCILPATRLALNTLPPNAVADGSALFNLMRNLGGAIGIALIDTILQQRTPDHVLNLVARLQAGDPIAARLIGLPSGQFHNHSMGPVDELTKALIAPLVRKAALVLSFNEAWLLIGSIFAISLLVLPWMSHLRVTAIEPELNKTARMRK